MLENAEQHVVDLLSSVM